MDIQIQGLSAKQRAFADILWACDGRDQVAGFLKSLPTSQRREAEVVLHMMIAAVYDNCEEIQPETTELLDKFR